MRAKLKAVKTELILLGLAAVFLGALWGVSVRDRAMPESVAVSTEKDLPPEEIQVVLVDLNTAGVDELTTLPSARVWPNGSLTTGPSTAPLKVRRR